MTLTIELISPDKDLTLLGEADLKTDIDHDPALLPGHSGHLLRGHQGGEQQLARHNVGLHHLGINVLLAHNLKINKCQFWKLTRT